MRYIDLIRDFLAEGGVATSRFTPKSIDVYPPNSRRELHYRLTVENNNLRIRRLAIKGKMVNGRIHYLSERDPLLTLDLHNPSSLTHLRQWLGTIGYHSPSNL